MAISSPDLKAFLLATPFFGGLSDASLDLLVSMLVERRFDAGATVVAEGEPGRSMFIVRSGELVVSKLGNSGRVIRMAGLEPGDFFGEMTLIEMQNRSASDASHRMANLSKPWRLVEGHPDPLVLPPDDVTGNVRAVRFKNKVETLGDVVGLCNIERRPRNGHVAD